MDLIKVVQYDQKQVSWFSLQMDKGGNFINLRDCGAALVGEYNRVIKYYQLS